MYDEGSDWDAELAAHPRSILRDRCDIEDLMSRHLPPGLRFPILGSLRMPETKGEVQK